VEARENESNAACFEALPGWFQAGGGHDAPEESVCPPAPPAVLVAPEAEELWEAP
jgi:hypothetical protein